MPILCLLSLNLPTPPAILGLRTALNLKVLPPSRLEYEWLVQASNSGDGPIGLFACQLGGALCVSTVVTQGLFAVAGSNISRSIGFSKKEFGFCAHNCRGPRCVSSLSFDLVR